MENKETICIGSLAFFASIGVLLIIITAIHFLVPDVLDVQYITANFAVPIDDFVAEKSEKLQYMVSVLTFPFVFFGFYLLFRKFIKNANEKLIKFLIIMEIILGVIIFPLPFIFSDQTRQFYFIKYATFGISMVSIFILGLLFFLNNRNNKILKKTISVLSFSIVGFYILQLFNVFNVKTFSITDATLIHFEAYFYPIYKTLSGLTPGVDFRNLYGFYPYIYSLFFNLENVSIHKIALFNDILIMLISFFIFGIIYKNIKDKVIAFMTFSTCIIFSLIFGLYSFTSLYYYQYFPHRVFFVALIAFMITAYLKIKNEKVKKIMEYLGYFISSISIFWNMESGIAALAGWGSMFFYLSLNKENKIKNISLVFLKIALSFIFAFFLIFLVTYLYSHKIINPLGLFFGQFIFYEKGFYMLKMNPLEQPFLPVIVPYLIALSTSIKHVIENRINKMDVIKFTLAVIGFATFIYFQGRSHTLCVSAVSYPAFIIVGILTEEYYLKYMEYKNEKTTLSSFISKSNFVKFLILFILLSLMTVRGIIYMALTPQAMHNHEAKFIKNSPQIANLKLLDKNEKYDILTQDASFYYVSLKQPDSKPFSHIVDCFLKNDFEKINEYLKTSDNKLVLDEFTMDRIDLNYIRNNYLLEKSNGNIYIFVHK